MGGPAPRRIPRTGIPAAPVFGIAAPERKIADTRWMPVPLTSRDRQKLKARAHALEPVVQVGQAGVTDKVAQELDRALTAHELIKVKVTAADRDEREALCEDIIARANAAEVQRVGKVLVLYRPRPEEDDE